MDGSINVKNIVQHYFMEFEEEFSGLQSIALIEKVANKVNINIYFYEGLCIANNLGGNFNIFINNKKDDEAVLKTFVYFLGIILIYKETLNKSIELPFAELKRLALDFSQQFNLLLNRGY